MIYLASDHRGFSLKNNLVDKLQADGYEVEDMGPNALNSEDDYPDYVEPVMEKIQSKPDDKAVVICANGVGVSIAANKFNGIRAALSWNPEHASTSRFDDDTNVLALPSDFIDEETAYNTVTSWLNTNFSGETRHNRRISKISSIEDKQ